MFEQQVLSDSAARKGWSFAASLAIQALGLAGLLMAPLVNTYEIDLAMWPRGSIALAVPPPPAPPPPAVPPAPSPPRARYEAEFLAPAAIPDKVSILHDTGAPASPVASLPAGRGLDGGLGKAGVEGVLGMFPIDSASLALPPPVRVGGKVQHARLTRRVQPVYPPEAVEQYVSGRVRLEAIVAVDGNVRDLKLIDGHPLLALAAMQAVAQWRYRPTRLNGREVEVITLIEVNFNLTVIDEEEAKRRSRDGRRSRGN